MTKEQNPSSRVKPSACPKCGKMLDGATNCTGSGKPEVADFSVCLYCAAFLRFTKTMCLELATDADLVALGEEQPIALAILLKARNLIQDRLLERALRN